jgi:hypothetical protein
MQFHFLEYVNRIFGTVYDSEIDKTLTELLWGYSQVTFIPLKHPSITSIGHGKTHKAVRSRIILEILEIIEFLSGRENEKNL